MVRKVDIWNDNVYTDNYRLFFDDLDTEKPEKIVLTKFDDDKNNPPNKWEFEIVDKEYIDTADAILQAQIDVINEEIADDCCKLIECPVVLPSEPLDAGSYYTTGIATINTTSGFINVELTGTTNVFTNVEGDAACKTSLEKSEILIEGVASLVVVSSRLAGLTYAYAIINRDVNDIVLDPPITISEIFYQKMEDLELRVETLETRADAIDVRVDGLEEDLIELDLTVISHGEAIEAHTHQLGEIYNISIINKDNITNLQTKVAHSMSEILLDVYPANISDFPDSDGTFSIKCDLTLHFENELDDVTFTLVGMCSILNGEMNGFNLNADLSFDRVAYATLTYREGEQYYNLFMLVNELFLDTYDNYSLGRVQFTKAVADTSEIESRLTELQTGLNEVVTELEDGLVNVVITQIENHDNGPGYTGIFLSQRTLLIHEKSGNTRGARMDGYCFFSYGRNFDGYQSYKWDEYDSASKVKKITATYISNGKLNISAIMTRNYYETTFDHFEAYEPAYYPINITDNRLFKIKSFNSSFETDYETLKFTHVLGENTISVFGSIYLEKIHTMTYQFTLQNTDVETQIEFPVTLGDLNVASGVITKSDNGGGYETAKIDVIVSSRKEVIFVTMYTTTDTGLSPNGFGFEPTFSFNFTLPVKRAPHQYAMITG